MWNIFKSKTRIREERLTAEKRAADLKNEIKIIEDKLNKEIAQEYKSQIEYAQKANSFCSKCGSKNVNDRIKRQQGELNGKFEGHGWNALTLGSSSSYGTISGKLDTNEVNKCNDCQNEWEKREVGYTFFSEEIETKVRYVLNVLEARFDAIYCKFDALDLTEKFNSFEEKKAYLMKEAASGFYFKHSKEFWSNTSLDALNFFAKKYLKKYGYEKFIKYYDVDFLLTLGFLKNK